MSFMWGVDITRAIGRVGLKVQPVLGPEIARATASAIWASVIGTVCLTFHLILQIVKSYTGQTEVT